jgi:UDP-glucose 4-epimerase
MNILITGYKGQIGSLLAKKLEDFGVKGIDLKDGMNLLTCELPEADVIYHLAAQSSVESSWHDPVHDMDNIRMTARLVKEYPNARIIYANSAAAQDPKSPYGFSKWASGEYLKKFHEDYISCVFPNVYGGSDKSVVDIFDGRKNVTVYGDGLQIRDYVHVDDIIDGLIKAMYWDVGEYFMGSGIKTTVLDLAKGKNITFAPARQEARESVLENTTPNWEPKIKVLEYIK